jgi:hypothetical protein
MEGVEMTEEEKMIFWGDLVEPMTALLGGLLVRGEYKLVDVVRDIVAKAENAALEEREACAKLMGELTCMGNAKECFEVAATYIRARGKQ